MTLPSSTAGAWDSPYHAPVMVAEVLALHAGLVILKEIELIGSAGCSPRDLAEVLQLIDGGSIEPVIDSVFPLRDGRDAFARLTSGEQFGKVVIEVGES